MRSSAGGRDGELNARARKHVHMTSSIFDAGGPDNTPLYAPGRQQELYKNLKETFSYAKRPPEMAMPRPAEMKYAGNLGSNSVLPGGGGYSPGQGGERRDPQFMPKEFWQTSVDLQWHDVRNERCREKSHGHAREQMDAKAKKMQEFSSELFEKARMKEPSTTSAREELMADTSDFLKVDSALHERHIPTRRAPGGEKASSRFYANLASSSHNTMPQHEAARQATEQGARAAPSPDTARTSGGEMRNYSDLFGSEMGRRQGNTTEREDILGTRNCSFMDCRTEIAARKKDPRRSDDQDMAAVAANRNEAEMSSGLFGNESPRRNERNQLDQVIGVERGCWESRECMEITSEISRRRREKDFRQDFDGQAGKNHAARKQDGLSSTQVRRNLGAAPVPQASASSPRLQRFASPRSPARMGPKSSERENLLRSAKDTKLASLQSSIFY